MLATTLITAQDKLLCADFITASCLLVKKKKEFAVLFFKNPTAAKSIDGTFD